MLIIFPATKLYVVKVTELEEIYVVYKWAYEIDVVQSIWKWFCNKLYSEEKYDMSV